MLRTFLYSLLCLLLLSFVISCSSGGGGIIAPPANEANTATLGESGTTACFGLWQFTIDTNTGSVDITKMRGADKIINVLGFMEPPALSSMDLDWADLVINPEAGTIDVGVIFKHPIPDDVFTGFDVRGVCFGPEVANADGLTIIPSPEFFSGVPFGYQDGLLGAPDSFGEYSGLAGYKYYCDDIGEDEVLANFFSVPANLDARGAFSAGENIQRNFILDWNDVEQNFLIFNYAIYANYDWPVGDPPIEVDDFTITTANSAEAFCADFTELASSLYYDEGTATGGGSISLQAEIWDWQGDISEVTIESLELGIMAKTDYDVALGVFPNGYSYGYEFLNVAASPTSLGDLDLLITATDAKTFGEYWFLDLLDSGHAMYGENIYNCFIYTATVVTCPPAVVTAIDPISGNVDTDVDDAEITGTFINGTELAVTLKMTGETDIVCTDVTFLNGTTITCDFSLTGAAEGDWDVVVTNGCGTPGTGADLFEVTVITFGEMDPVMVASEKEYYHTQFIEDSNGVYHIFASWEDSSDTTWYTWETRWFHSEDQGQTWTAEGDIYGAVSGGNRKPPTLAFAAAVDDHGGVYILMGESKQNATGSTGDVLRAKIRYLDTATYTNPSTWSPSDWAEKWAMTNIYGYRYAGALSASLSVTPDGRILGTILDYVQLSSRAKYFYADSWTALPASAAGAGIIANMPSGFTVDWWGGQRTNTGVYNPVTDTFFVVFAGYFNEGSGNHGGAWVWEYDPNASGQPWSLSASWADPTVTATTNRLFYNYYGDLAVDSSGNLYWVHQYCKRPTSYSFNNVQFTVLYGKRDIKAGTWDLRDNPINTDYILPPAPPNSATNQADNERRSFNIVANSNDDLIFTWYQCSANANLLGATNSGSGWTAMPGNLVIDKADHEIYAYSGQGEALEQYVGLAFVSKDDPPVDRRGQLWFFITDGQ